jgi:hypothetical protein
MTTTATNGAGRKSRSLFSPAERERLLKLTLRKPTGTVVTLGEIEFDLLPMSTSDGLEVLGLVEKFADIFGKVRTQGGISESEIARLASEEGGRVIALAKKMLRDAAGANAPDEVALFDEWFALLPLADTMRTLVPAVLQANGIASLRGNAPGPAAPAESAEPEATASPSSTSSATS